MKPAIKGARALAAKEHRAARRREKKQARTAYLLASAEMLALAGIEEQRLALAVEQPLKKRRHKMLKFPRECREKVKRNLDRGVWTIERAAAWLVRKGHQISAVSVGAWHRDERRKMRGKTINPRGLIAASARKRKLYLQTITDYKLVDYIVTAIVAGNLTLWQGVIVFKAAGWTVSIKSVGAYVRAVKREMRLQGVSLDPANLVRRDRRTARTVPARLIRRAFLALLNRLATVKEVIRSLRFLGYKIHECDFRAYYREYREAAWALFEQNSELWDFAFISKKTAAADWQDADYRRAFAKRCRGRIFIPSEMQYLLAA